MGSLQQSGFVAVLVSVLGGCQTASTTPSPQPPRSQATAVECTSLVMVSIDGLRPDYVHRAEAYGMSLPTLRRMRDEGAAAFGVRGMLPTVTYPSHMTLMTGVSPARHGVLANEPFDPLGERFQEGSWYFYANGVTTPTLWSVVGASGRKTANVFWPTTVGATIDENVPEFWRSFRHPYADDASLLRALSTRGLYDDIEAHTGPFPYGRDWELTADRQRCSAAAYLLRTRRPALLTLHLLALDTEQHRSGPLTPPVFSTLTALDTCLAELRASAHQVCPSGDHLAVVSDHGFAAVAQQVHLAAAFRQAGLLEVDPTTHRLTQWLAYPWVAGGTAAIMLRDPNDAALTQRVGALLNELKASPEGSIDQILTRDQIAARGGFPGASYVLFARPPYLFGADMELPVLREAHYKGHHGFAAEHPDMLASFFVAGPRVPRGKRLGVIDMRDVAPTLAHVFNLTLPSAEGRPLWE